MESEEASTLPQVSLEAWFGVVGERFGGATATLLVLFFTCLVFLVRECVEWGVVVEFGPVSLWMVLDAGDLACSVLS